jgi:E3 ubiquitin-protein ligase RNF213
VDLHLGSDEFETILIAEQNGYLSDMELPEGIAPNTALLENVFVVLVCILNKIPVFVVGKPGMFV